MMAPATNHKHYNVYSAFFIHLGTVKIQNKNQEENAALALAQAKREFPHEVGLMVSPIATWNQS